MHVLCNDEMDIQCIKGVICEFSKYHKTHKAETTQALERNKLDVVVTTYETCRDNVVSYKHMLTKFHLTVD